MPIAKVTCEKILDCIRGHNKLQPIRGPSIVNQVSELSSDVELRKYINAMRGATVPICSSSDGYWLGDPQDCYQCCEELTGRIMGIQKAITGLRSAADRMVRKQHITEQRLPESPTLVTIP